MNFSNHFFNADSISLNIELSFDNKFIFTSHGEIKSSVFRFDKVIDKIITIHHILSKMILF